MFHASGRLNNGKGGLYFNRFNSNRCHQVFPGENITTCLCEYNTFVDEPWIITEPEINVYTPECDVPTEGEVLLSNKTCSLKNTVDVSGHLTILGNRPHGLLSEIRALVDNSVQNMRLFTLVSSSTLGKSLTLKRIKLTGGHGSMDGGQIFLNKPARRYLSVVAGSFERQAAKRGGLYMPPPLASWIFPFGCHTFCR